MHNDWEEMLKQKIGQLEQGNVLCSLLRNCGEQQASIDNRAICRIAVTSRIFNWQQPPDRSKFTSGTGTGFVLQHPLLHDPNRLYIITAHHVVDDSIQIRVHFDEVASESIEAVLVGSNPAMDVALLQIPDIPALRRKDGMGAGLLYNSAKDVDKQITALTRVTAIGFALGKPHLQTTQGVISGRVTEPSRLQVDVAVNPGNSGGPLVDADGYIVGVVTSGMTHAQGINYVAPIYETMLCIERILERRRYAPRLFVGGQKVVVADGKVCCEDDQSRSVPLFKGRIADRRVVPLPEHIPDDEAPITIQIDGLPISFFNVSRAAIYDSLPSLNIQYTKANQILVSTIDKECKSGVCVTSVHPAVSAPFLCAGDAYHSDSTRLYVQRPSGEVIFRNLSSATCDASALQIDEKGTVTQEMVRASALCVNGQLIENAQGVLCAGDIICRLKGVTGEFVDIDQQMRVEVDYWRNGPNDEQRGKLPFLAVLDRETPGNVVVFDVYRRGDDGESRIVKDVRIVLQTDMSVFREMYPDMEPVNFACRAGIFVMAATPHLSRYYRTNFNQLMDTPTNRFKSALVITSMLPESPYSESNTIGVGDIVVAINGHRVRTVEDYKQAWRVELCGVVKEDDGSYRIDAPDQLVSAEETEQAIQVGDDMRVDLDPTKIYNTDIVFRLPSGQFKRNLSAGKIVTLLMRDGSMASCHTPLIDEVDRLVVRTYNPAYVTL